MFAFDWLLYAFIGVFLYSCTNLIDKAFLETVSSKTMPFYVGRAAFVAFLALLFVGGGEITSIASVAQATVAGMILGGSYVLYFKALDLIKVSKVTFLFQLNPLMVLGISYLAYGQIGLNNTQLFGYFLVLIAAIFAVFFKEKIWEKSSEKLIIATILIVVYNFLFSLANVFIDILLKENTSFSQIVTFEALGVFLGTMIFIIFPKMRKTLKEEKLSKKQIAFLGTNELLFILSKFAMYFAYTKGPIVKVSLVEAINPLIVWILSILLMKYFTSLKEEVSVITVAVKVISVMIIMFGLYLLG